MTAIELRLGPRPDEPGPPIGQGPQSYSADVRERLVRQGYEVHASTPAEYTAYIRRERQRNQAVIEGNPPPF